MSERRAILVIDDEPSICDAFRGFFARRDWVVRTAASGAEGLAAARREPPDVIFLDVRLPDADGLDVLGELASAAPGAAVVVITAYGGLETVMRSLGGRAFDYLPKPVDLDRAAELAARAAGSGWSSVAGAPARASRVIGTSPAMQEVFKQVARVARHDATVLLLGRTGTGKEVIARALHEHSARRAGPFVAVNCGALPENLTESELFGHARGAFTGATEARTGRFEAADGGTLLLDEVGELPPAAQVKLLRVLDCQTIERVGSARPVHVDVRIVAATNRDLEADVRSGRFRADLYYRLAVVQIALPPLTDRPEDIVPLAEHFLAVAGRGHRLGDAAAEVLSRYPWPGNVRELRNAVEHAVAVCPGEVITPDDLPEPVRRNAPRPGRGGQPASPEEAARAYLGRIDPAASRAHRDAISPVERAVIEEALRRFGGKQSEAAAWLGLHRNTLRKKLRQLGLSDVGS
ncbi:MAG: sigma-54-dependent transcriptional regulator [Planctomycetota bacterium]